MQNNHEIPERLVPGTLAWTLFSFEHQQRYLFFAERCKGLDVLDIACGVGYGSKILADGGSKYVLGIDISEDAVYYAEQNYVKSNLYFQQGNAEQIPSPDSSFDIAVSFETIEHVRNPHTFLKEIHRVLKPEGLFICSTPNKDFYYKPMKINNPYHVSEMTFQEFKEAFEKLFCIQEQYFQSHSQSYHRHIQLLRELEQMNKAVRYSKLFAFENYIRKLLSKEHWQTLPLSPDLARAVPGDFIIEPLGEPDNSHLTFILTGKKK